MDKITSENIQQSYELGKKVSNGSISKKEAKIVLNKGGMDIKSAGIYLTCIIALLSNDHYLSTVNADATEFFLKHIYIDYGKELLIDALKVFKSHIEYQEGKNDLPSLWEIYDRYSQKI